MARAGSQCAWSPGLLGTLPVARSTAADRWALAGEPPTCTGAFVLTAPALPVHAQLQLLPARLQVALPRPPLPPHTRPPIPPQPELPQGTQGTKQGAVQVVSTRLAPQGPCSPQPKAASGSKEGASQAEPDWPGSWVEAALQRAKGRGRSRPGGAPSPTGGGCGEPGQGVWLHPRLCGQQGPPPRGSRAAAFCPPSG